MRRVSTFGRSGDVVPASTPAVYRIRDMPTILPRSVSVPTQQGLSASRSGICPGSAIPLVGSVNARQGRPGPRRQLRIPPPPAFGPFIRRRPTRWGTATLRAIRKRKEPSFAGLLRWWHTRKDSNL